MEPMSAEIYVKNITKTFGNGLTVLKDVSFQVKPGEFLSIVGPSGCGKTTLLRLLAGLDSPSEGEIKRQTAVPGRLPNSMLFQDLALFPWRSVYKNIALGLEFQKRPQEETDQAVRAQLKNMRLEGFEEYYPHQLSGGMKQRVALARALVSDPELLLMDEPLGALDAALRRLLQEELLTALHGQKKTVIFVTHNIEEALLLGDRILLLSAQPGRVKAEIKVPFPGRRGLSLLGSPEFTALAARIWKLLEEELRASPPGFPAPPRPALPEHQRILRNS